MHSSFHIGENFVIIPEHIFYALKSGFICNIWIHLMIDGICCNIGIELFNISAIHNFIDRYISSFILCFHWIMLVALAGNENNNKRNEEKDQTFLIHNKPLSLF